MRNVYWLIALLGLVFAGCDDDAPTTQVDSAPSKGAPSADESDEEEVALDKLPAAVRAAAEKAVPGIVLQEADRETEDGTVVYDVEGEANGKEYELEITADGKVLEVESEDDDSEADDDDTEDDDDDDDDEDDD